MFKHIQHRITWIAFLFIAYLCTNTNFETPDSFRVISYSKYQKNSDKRKEWNGTVVFIFTHSTLAVFGEFFPHIPAEYE